MITIDYSLLEKELTKAIRKARELNRKIFFTFSTECEDIHPILFLLNHQHLYKGERFFWTNKSHSKVKVGVGHSKVYDINNEKDISTLEAVVNEEKNYVYKSGFVKKSPILFGGFPFSVERKRAAEWKEYGNGKFVIPFFLLEKNESEQLLVITKELSAESSVKQILKEIKHADENFWSQWKKEFTYEMPSLVQKEETPINVWQKWIRQVKEAFQNEDIQKIVLARRKCLTYKKAIPVELLVERLYTTQINSYIFLFEAGHSAFVGASPEKLLEKKEQQLSTMALAGSIKRGDTIKEDQLLSQFLLNDEKNLWEHQLVVQDIVNVLKSSKLLPVYNKKPIVMKMKDIQHLYTKIDAKARNSSLLEYVLKLHPTPALGGFPKEKACRCISRIEDYDRGLYAAPLGYISFDDEGEFLVALRSGLIKEKSAYLYAGCGLVQSSDALSEFDETETKFKPMLRALGEGSL